MPPGAATAAGDATPNLFEGGTSLVRHAAIARPRCFAATLRTAAAAARCAVAACAAACRCLSLPSSSASVSYNSFIHSFMLIFSFWGLCGFDPSNEWRRLVVRRRAARCSAHRATLHRATALPTLRPCRLPLPPQNCMHRNSPRAAKTVAFGKTRFRKTVPNREGAQNLVHPDRPNTKVRPRILSASASPLRPRSHSTASHTSTRVQNALGTHTARVRASPATHMLSCGNTRLHVKSWM